MALTTTYNIDCHGDLRATTIALCNRIFALRDSSTHGQRLLIALAGAPGSGKTTISRLIVDFLKSCGVESVAIVPMDGFHLPKSTLAASIDPENAFRRRGAPFTFDASAFVDAVTALRRFPVSQASEVEVMRLPSFDHATQDPVENDIPILASVELVIVEGNYVLLDEEPWSKIASMVDERWFINVSEGVALQRLAERHLDAGIEDNLADAVARAEGNDLPNGTLIRTKLVTPDIVIQN